MNLTTLASSCALAGIAAGREIRDTVQAMSLRDRARPCTSILKPQGNKGADAAAEAVGIRHLERLSTDIGHTVKLVPEAGHPAYVIGRPRAGAVVWVSFDAIDGTIKVAGLGNDLRRHRIRAANDGTWAPTMAFTAPTEKQPEDLRLRDFIAAAIVDGNPTAYPSYPRDLIAVPGRDGRSVTFELTGTRRRRLFTTSNRNLAHSFVFLDAFQAYDRATSAPGDEELVVDLYRLLVNRHEGGAYDVLRHFGSLSALQRMMLGWRERSRWQEAQGAAFIVVNENLPNLIPAVVVMEGAGGVCVDFDDRPLRARRLGAGRTSIVYAANRAIHRTVMGLVRSARAAVAAAECRAAAGACT